MVIIVPHRLVSNGGFMILKYVFCFHFRLENKTKTGIAVVYDEEANLIVTVFKPIEGLQFFQLYQVNPIRIPREEWQV